MAKRKEPGEHRQVMIHVRMTEAEHAKLLAVATRYGMGISTWIRHTAILEANAETQEASAPAPIEHDMSATDLYDPSDPQDMADLAKDLLEKVVVVNSAVTPKSWERTFELIEVTPVKWKVRNRRTRKWWMTFGPRHDVELRLEKLAVATM